MNDKFHPIRGQQGSMLLEGLIAILIFSMGILAIVGMQGASIKNVSDAKYRMDAANLADQLIGQMWADDKTTATLQAKYNSPSGAGFTAWKTDVQNTLPGVAANPPTVAIDGNNLATVTVLWQAPGSATSHKHVVMAQVRSTNN